MDELAGLVEVLTLSLILKGFVFFCFGFNL